MELNYKNSYSITKGDDLYTFQTKFNVDYFVSFSDWENPANDLIIKNITLGEVSTMPSKVGIDNRIGVTVEGIILDFFSQNIEAALFYVCDTQNQQERKRYTRFKRWFENAETKELVLLEPPIELVHQGFNFAIIVHSGPNEIKARAFMSKSIEDLTK